MTLFSSEFSVEEWVIIIEFSLVIIIFLITLPAKFFNAFSKKWNKKIHLEIEQYINSLVLGLKTFNKKDFKKRWYDLDLLIFCIEENDKINKPNWISIRQALITQIVAPLAKMSAPKNRLKFKINAARAFSLFKEKGNDEIINQFVQSDIPLIFLYGVKAACVNESKIAIETIIDKMANNIWASLDIYVQGFSLYPPENSSYFESKLINEKDNNVRAIYYKILSQFPAKAVSWDVSKDIFSDNEELKISAIKFITLFDREKAIPLLTKALDDANWNVRLVAIHRLAFLHAKKSIPEIAYHLEDQDWWVRLSAREALNDLKK